MSWLQALIAGIIQGVTEFLPVSSSGHLVIFHSLFGEGDESYFAYTVFLHLATLLSVFVVFRKDVWMLVREFIGAIADIAKGKPDFKTPERRFLLMVIIGTIPIALIGGTISMLGISSILENIFVVAVMLVVTSILMFCVDRINIGKYTEADASYKSAIIVGLFQSIAILPGLSRSGSTIFGGLLTGLKKDFAVKYSFILSIPAILGAGIVEMFSVIGKDSIEINPTYWVIGFIVAATCGIIAIQLIKVLIRSKKFYVFGIYCLFVSILAFLVGFGVIS